MTISYAPGYAPTWTRRSDLEETYFFECACAKCTALGLADLDPLGGEWALEGLLCPRKGCRDGLLLADEPDHQRAGRGWVCTSCLEVTSSVAKQNRQAAALAAALADRSAPSAAEAYNRLRAALVASVGALHPRHGLRFASHAALFGLALCSANLSEVRGANKGPSAEGGTRLQRAGEPPLAASAPVAVREAARGHAEAALACLREASWRNEHRKAIDLLSGFLAGLGEE